MFGNKSRRIIKQADAISSAMEEMNSLSWGRVLDIAKDLQHNPNVTDARILSEELMLIAQTNLSMFSRMGVMPMAGQLKAPSRELTEEEKRLASQETAPLKAIGEGPEEVKQSDTTKRDEVTESAETTAAETTAAVEDSSETDAQRAMDALYGPEEKDGTSKTSSQKKASAAKKVTAGKTGEKAPFSSEAEPEAKAAGKKRNSTGFRAGITQRIGYISPTNIANKAAKKDATETTTQDSSGAISYASQSLTEQFRSLGINDVNHVVLPSGVEVIEGGLVEDMLKHPEKAQVPLTPVTPAPENPVDKEFSDALQADFDVIIGGKRKWTFSPRDEAAAHKKTRISRRFGKPAAPKPTVPIIESEIKVLDPISGEVVQEISQAPAASPLAQGASSAASQELKPAPEGIIESWDIPADESAQEAIDTIPVADEFAVDVEATNETELVKETEPEVEVAVATVSAIEDSAPQIETETESELEPEFETEAVSEEAAAQARHRLVDALPTIEVESASHEAVLPRHASPEQLQALLEEDFESESEIEAETEVESEPKIETEAEVEAQPEAELESEELPTAQVEASADRHDDVTPEAPQSFVVKLFEADDVAAAVPPVLTGIVSELPTQRFDEEQPVEIIEQAHETQAVDDGIAVVAGEAEDTLLEETATEELPVDELEPLVEITEDLISEGIAEKPQFKSAYEAEVESIAQMMTKLPAQKTSFADRVKGLFGGSRRNVVADEAAPIETSEPVEASTLIEMPELAEDFDQVELVEQIEPTDELEPVEIIQQVDEVEPSEASVVAETSALAVESEQIDLIEAADETKQSETFESHEESEQVEASKDAEKAEEPEIINLPEESEPLAEVAEESEKVDEAEETLESVQVESFELTSEKDETEESELSEEQESLEESEQLALAEEVTVPEEALEPLADELEDREALESVESFDFVSDSFQNEDLEDQTEQDLPIASEPVFKPMPKQKTSFADRFAKLFKRNHHESDQTSSWRKQDDDDLIFALDNSESLSEDKDLEQNASSVDVFGEPAVADTESFEPEPEAYETAFETSEEEVGSAEESSENELTSDAELLDEEVTDDAADQVEESAESAQEPAAIEEEPTEVIEPATEDEPAVEIDELTKDDSGTELENEETTEVSESTAIETEIEAVSETAESDSVEADEATEIIEPDSAEIEVEEASEAAEFDIVEAEIALEAVVADDTEIKTETETATEIDAEAISETVESDNAGDDVETEVEAETETEAALEANESSETETGVEAESEAEADATLEVDKPRDVQESADQETKIVADAISNDTAVTAEKEDLLHSAVEEMLHDLRSQEPIAHEEKLKALSLDLTNLGAKDEGPKPLADTVQEALHTEILGSRQNATSEPRIVSHQDLSTIFGELDIAASAVVEDSEPSETLETVEPVEPVEPVESVDVLEISVDAPVLEESMESSSESLEEVPSGQSIDNEQHEATQTEEEQSEEEGEPDEVIAARASHSRQAVEDRALEGAPAGDALSRETFVEEDNRGNSDVDINDTDDINNTGDFDDEDIFATKIPKHASIDFSALDEEESAESTSGDHAASGEVAVQSVETETETKLGAETESADEVGAAVEAEAESKTETEKLDELEEAAAFKKASRGFHAASSSVDFKEASEVEFPATVAEPESVEEFDPIAEMWASLEPAKKPAKKTGKKTGKHADPAPASRVSLRAALFGEPESEKGKKGKKDKTDKKAKSAKKAKKDKAGKHNKHGYVSLAQYGVSSDSDATSSDDPFMTASFGEFARPTYAQAVSEQDVYQSSSYEPFQEPTFASENEEISYGYGMHVGYDHMAFENYTAPTSEDLFESNAQDTQETTSDTPETISPEITAPLPVVGEDHPVFVSSTQDEEVWADSDAFENDAAQDDTYDEMLWDFEEDYDFEKRGKHSSMKFGRHSKGFGKHASLSFDEPIEEELPPETESDFDTDALSADRKPAHSKDESSSEVATFHQFYESHNGDFIVYEDEDGHLVSVKTSRLS